MLENAPTFFEVRNTVLDWLDNAVLCAHNVRFDYGFLKNEFKRMGITFEKKLLCTVKLSRKLYPQHKSHSLDAIIERFQLICKNRHRAMDDTEMMAAFIRAAINELGESIVREAAQSLLKQQAIPVNLDHLEIDAIPETCGVYLFYGDSALLYVGKSVTQEIRRVEYRVTSGELGALLLESRLIKDYQPIYNRQLRRERQLCAWLVSDNPNAKPLVSLIYESDIIGPPQPLYGLRIFR